MISEKDQWLTTVRPTLGAIRSHADWIKYHCKGITDSVRMLPYRPAFETEAQAEIEAAIVELTNTIKLLAEAQAAYMVKPVER